MLTITDLGDDQVLINPGFKQLNDRFVGENFVSGQHRHCDVDAYGLRVQDCYSGSNVPLKSW